MRSCWKLDGWYGDTVCIGSESKALITILSPCKVRKIKISSSQVFSRIIRLKFQIDAASLRLEAFTKPKPSQMARVGCVGGGQIAHKWPTICRSSEAWLTLALSIEPEIFLNFHHHKILNQNVNKSLYGELTYLPYNLHSRSDIGLLKKA